MATLILSLLGASALFIAVGFSGTLANATLTVWDTITLIPSYLSQFLMLSSSFVPSWIMAIIISILGIAMAYLIVKIFQHLISAIT